jgi:hypothetical protein
LVSVPGYSVPVGLPFEEVIELLNKGIPGKGVTIRIHCLESGRIKTFSLEDKLAVHSKLRELKSTWRVVRIGGVERAKFLCDGTHKEICDEFGTNIFINGLDISKGIISPKKRKAKRSKNA